MPLATTLAAGGMRPASFLPAIKCSDCGNEIEIAAMGDHICDKSLVADTKVHVHVNNPYSLSPIDTPGPSPISPSKDAINPYTLGRLDTSGPASPPRDSNYTTQSDLPVTRVRAPTVGSPEAPTIKSFRSAPPRINPAAANKPFLAPQGPLPRSPISPASSIRSGSSGTGRKPMIRSATSPLSPAPRLYDPRPPSPQLTGGYDCAFPPFSPGQPMPPGRPSTSNSHRSPMGERAPSRGGFRPERPSTAQGGLMPGSRKPSDGQSVPPMPTQMDGRRPSDTYSTRSRDGSVPRPTTSNSQHSQPDGQKREAPPRPVRPQVEVLSPTFMNSFSNGPLLHSPSTIPRSQSPEPLRSSDRSRTLPIRKGSGVMDDPTPGISRASTEPMSQRRRSPSSATGSVSSTDLLTQSTLQNGSRTDPRLQNAPPVPKAVQEHRQNYSHASSQSSSSNGSKHSYAGSSVGGPSPSVSAASSFDAFSPLREVPAPYGDDEQMRVAGLTFKQPEKLNIETNHKPAPINFARPRPEALSPQEPPKMPAALRTPDESPIDPGYTGRTGHNQPWQAEPQPAQPLPSKTNTSPRKPLSPPPAKPAPNPKVTTDYDAFRPRRAPSPLPPTERAASPPRAAPAPIQTQFPPAPRAASPPRLAPAPIQTQVPPQERAASPARLAPAPIQTQLPLPPTPSFPPPHTPSLQSPAIRRPTTPGNRPVCRGCTKTIEGKSVKAADGRLTGRWHKQCFTCRTCAQPFATADFYVIDNQPYCEHHYHEANGSLCAGCNRGIEGQYLETTSSNAAGGPPTDKKFHPTCFTCVDCKVVLADDYFEIKDKVYCERHALAAMRSQPRMGGPPPAAGNGNRGLGAPGGLSAPVDRRGLMAERRTTRLMNM